MRKHTIAGRLALIFIEIAMILLTISFLYPLIYILLNALKSNSEYYKNPYGLPAAVTFENFRSLIVDYSIMRNIGNSLFISVISTILIVLVSSVASYAFAKLRFKGKWIAFVTILATMFLPAQITMIPRYTQFAKMGLSNTPWAVILTYLVSGIPSAVLLLKNTFAGISNEVIESAKIDGAGFFTIISKIVMPMSAAGLAIVVIFQFLFCWNDYLTPLLYLSEKKTQTIMVILASMMERYSNYPATQYAGLLVSTIPTIILYLLLQRYMVKGAMSGSIK